MLVSNALRVAVVSVVGDFLIWMGKLCIACAAGLLAFAISDTKYYTDPVKYPSMYLTSPILPIALSILIAYIVASLFSMVSAWLLPLLHLTQSSHLHILCHLSQDLLMQNVTSMTLLVKIATAKNIWNGWETLHTWLQLRCCGLIMQTNLSMIIAMIFSQKNDHESHSPH